MPATRTHAALFQQLNEYRISEGLTPLVYSKALELAANEHARDMSVRGYFSHRSPDGLKAPDRVKDAGFCHRYVGENLYWGRNSIRTPEEAMAGWKRSAGHDRNMRTPGYRYGGIGFYRVPKSDGWHYYWVQVMGFHSG